MQPPPQHSWINLSELKTQIIRKLGPERSKQYFDYLNKFLSLKLSKVEFDNLCLRTVGRDGIRLHNQLIRSIVLNACTTKAPVGNKNPLDGTQNLVTNGDVLLKSPRKARTGGQRRGGEHKSGLGPNGKINYPSPSSSAPYSDGFNTPLDNGNRSSPDTQTPVQHHQELMQQSQKDGKDVSRKTSLRAPLGIPYYPGSIGGARKAPCVKSSFGVSDTASLLDTITLRARMEPIAVAQGIQKVSPDSVNVLNNGLDVYLKGLIRSCCELNKPIKNNPAYSKPISLLDFRMAMELNPQHLGEDWPVLLEKICTHAFEE